MIYLKTSENDDFEYPSRYLRYSAFNDISNGYTIYAVTDNKNFLDEFKRTRDSGRFIYRNHKLDKEEKYDLFNVLLDIRLSEVQLNYDGGSIDIISNAFEMDAIDSVDGPESDLLNYVSYRYEFLNDTYIAALDKMMYCTFHDINQDYDGELSEYTEYNQSGYSITSQGRNIFYVDNSLERFVNMFGSLLREDMR